MTTPENVVVVSPPPEKVLVTERAVERVGVNAPGPAGVSGPQGPQGPKGARAGQRFYGDGPPGTIIGAEPGDEYVDRLTFDLYTLQ